MRPEPLAFGFLSAFQAFWFVWQRYRWLTPTAEVISALRASEHGVAAVCFQGRRPDRISAGVEGPGYFAKLFCEAWKAGRNEPSE